MRGTEATKRFRELLKGPDPIVSPGIFDPLTGRLAEVAGFKTIYVGGWTTGAHTTITEPLLTMTEQIAVTERIAQSVNVPVWMDGHTGGGDATHVARTVHECEMAGIAGFHIEDQVFPKRLGYHVGKKYIVPLKEAVHRLKVAMAARTDKNFFLVARTDAWGAEGGGLDEAIRRCNAYAEAGAEALLPLVFDPDEAVKLRNAVPGLPMAWLAGISGMNLREKSDSKGGDMTKIPELSIRDVQSMGYSIIVYPLCFIVASVIAVNKLLHEIRDTGTCNLSGYEVGRKAIQDVIKVESLYSLEDQEGPPPQH